MAAAAPAPEVKRSPSLNGDVEDVELSLRGMAMLLNNEWEEASALFTQYKSVTQYRSS
jgi:hypothetical protein